jgi:hypothetical protein
MSDGLRALEQLQQSHAGNSGHAEYGCAEADVNEGYEYNTYNGMYIGRAVVMDLRVGNWRHREGGGSFNSVFSAMRSMLLLEPVDELKQPRETGDKGGKQ